MREIDLHSLVDRVLQIELTDGRVVRGKAHCFDKHGTLMLAEAERLPMAHERRSKAKSLGLVLVLQRHRERVLLCAEDTSAGAHDTAEKFSSLSIT